MSWWGSGYKVPRAVAKQMVPRPCRICACFVGACIPAALVPRILQAAADGTLRTDPEIVAAVDELTRNCTRCQSPRRDNRPAAT